MSRRPALKIRFGKKGTKKWRDVATIWLNENDNGVWLQPSISAQEDQYNFHMGKAVKLAAQDDDYVFKCFYDEEQLALTPNDSGSGGGSGGGGGAEDDDIPF